MALSAICGANKSQKTGFIRKRLVNIDIYKNLRIFAVAKNIINGQGKRINQKIDRNKRTILILKQVII
jgi:hypothetical protein